MNISRTISTVGVGAAIVVGSMLAVNAVSAHGGGTEEQRTKRINALAERFNLDESEVETFFEEQRTERETERETKRAEHLSGLVEAGTIAQSQADELKALRDEAKAAAEALRESGADREEVRAQMEASRGEVEAWAEAQGINLDDIRPEKGEGHGRGQHRFHHEGLEES